MIEHRADQQLVSKIDRLDFNEDQLVTIKVPLNLPYQQNWSEFERYDGNVTVGGVQYKYVMRKVYNDSLILKCIPNESKKRIDNAAHRYYQLVNDLGHKGTQPEKSKGSFFKNLVTEFWDSVNTYAIESRSTLRIIPTVRNHPRTAPGHVLGSDRPPQA